MASRLAQGAKDFASSIASKFHSSPPHPQDEYTDTLVQHSDFYTDVKALSERLQKVVADVAEIHITLIDKLMLICPPSDCRYAQIVKMREIAMEFEKLRDAISLPLKAADGESNVILYRLAELLRQYKAKQEAVSLEQHYIKKLEGLRRRKAQIPSAPQLTTKISRNEGKHAQAAGKVKKLSDDVKGESIALIQLGVKDGPTIISAILLASLEYLRSVSLLAMNLQPLLQQIQNVSIAAGHQQSTPRLVQAGESPVDQSTTLRSPDSFWNSVKLSIASLSNAPATGPTLLRPSLRPTSLPIVPPAASSTATRSSLPPPPFPASIPPSSLRPVISHPLIPATPPPSTRLTQYHPMESTTKQSSRSRSGLKTAAAAPAFPGEGPLPIKSIYVKQIPTQRCTADIEPSRDAFFSFSQSENPSNETAARNFSSLERPLIRTAPYSPLDGTERNADDKMYKGCSAKDNSKGLGEVGPLYPAAVGKDRGEYPEDSTARRSNPAGTFWDTFYSPD